MRTESHRSGVPNRMYRALVNSMCRYLAPGTFPNSPGIVGPVPPPATSHHFPSILSHSGASAGSWAYRGRISFQTSLTPFTPPQTRGCSDTESETFSTLSDCDRARKNDSREATFLACHWMPGNGGSLADLLIQRATVIPIAPA